MLALCTKVEKKHCCFPSDSEERSGSIEELVEEPEVFHDSSICDVCLTRTFLPCTVYYNASGVSNRARITSIWSHWYFASENVSDPFLTDPPHVMGNFFLWTILIVAILGMKDMKAYINTTMFNSSRVRFTPLSTTIRRNPALFGIPFILIIVGTSFVLGNFTQARYDLHNQRVSSVSST